MFDRDGDYKGMQTLYGTIGENTILIVYSFDGP